MRKMIAGMQMSLDAMIEGPEGYADWVADWSDNYELTGEIDACVLGAGMYPGYEAYWDAIAKDPSQPLALTSKLPTQDEIDYAHFAVDTPHYVLTSTLDTAAWSKTRFLKSTDALDALKQAPGRTIYVIGGATTVASLLDAGLIDELRLIVHPLVVADGKTLFGTVTQRHPLSMKSVDQMPGGRLALRYSVPRT